MRAGAIDPGSIATDLLIDGRWRKSLSGATFTTINPATEAPLAEIACAGRADVDQAGSSAHAAFSSWQSLPPRDRAQCLHRLARLIEKNVDALARLETLDSGKPITDVRTGDLPAASEMLRYFAGHADKIHGRVAPVQGHLAYTRREPLGVVGLIVPWNHPVVMAVWKLAPALAAGNAVILKPSEKTPLTALALGALALEAGLPSGVLNVLPGNGAPGAFMAEHPGIDHLALKGSSRTGRSVLETSARSNLKGVSLELGGKSANIVFADATIEGAHQALFSNRSQNCVEGSRLFVDESIHDAFVERLARYPRDTKILGAPLDPATNFGPLVDQKQFESVMRFIDIGRAEATLRVGGRRVGERGYFVEPTIFTDVEDSMRIAKEEIFGPVLSVLKFRTLEEVIDRANHATPCALGAGIFTRDMKKADTLVRRLDAGTIYVNTYNLNPPEMPFVGFKESGFGRSDDTGAEAILTYTRVKSVIRPDA